MFKLALYFFVVLYQSIFFQCQNHQFDVEWDQKLMKIDKAFKCGIENKYKKGSKARVINGKMATNIRYPWMAEILRLVFNPKESDQRGTESYTGTGSIISHKAILTAAHNLCHWPIEEKANTWNKCLVDLHGVPSENQNPSLVLGNQNRASNQIHYSIGIMNSFDQVTIIKLMGDQLASFNKDINAFIHKYEPNWWNEGTDDAERLKRKRYMKNGDIGLIIVESKLGLDLKLNKAIPICLPLLKTISENQNSKGELKVSVVGRGKVYDQFTDEEGEKQHSCMTNEGVVKKRGPEYGPIQEVFLKCKLKLQEDVCVSMKNACAKKGNKKCTSYRHQLLSTSAQISFFQDSKGRRMRISLPRIDECDKLSKKVTNAINKLDKWRQRIFKQDDGLGPSRILVLDKGEKDMNLKEKYNEFKTQTIRNSKGAPVPYCYNLNRLAAWGICETESDVYNFGFCSSSCKVKRILPVKVNKKIIQYFELTADYHETWEDTKDELHSK